MQLSIKHVTLLLTLASVLISVTACIAAAVVSSAGAVERIFASSDEAVHHLNMLTANAVKELSEVGNESALNHTTAYLNTVSMQLSDKILTWLQPPKQIQRTLNTYLHSVPSETYLNASYFKRLQHILYSQFMGAWIGGNIIGCGMLNLKGAGMWYFEGTGTQNRPRPTYKEMQLQKDLHGEKHFHALIHVWNPGTDSGEGGAYAPSATQTRMGSALWEAGGQTRPEEATENCVTLSNASYTGFEWGYNMKTCKLSLDTLGFPPYILGMSPIMEPNQPRWTGVYFISHMLGMTLTTPLRPLDADEFEGPTHVNASWQSELRSNWRNSNRKIGITNTGISLGWVTKMLQQLNIGGEGSHGRMYTVIASSWLFDRAVIFAPHKLGKKVDPALNQVGWLIGTSHGASTTTAKCISDITGLLDHCPTVLTDDQALDPIIRGTGQYIRGHNGRWQYYLAQTRRVAHRFVLTHNDTTDGREVEEAFYLKVTRLNDGYGIDWYLVLTIDEEHVLGNFIRQQFTAGREVAGWLQDADADLRSTRTETESDLARNRLLLIAFVIVVMLLATGFATVLVGRIVRPLESLRDEMRLVACLRLDDVEADRPLSAFEEIRSMQASFQQQTRYLRAYKPYLPDAVLKKVESLSREMERRDRSASATFSSIGKADQMSGVDEPPLTPLAPAELIPRLELRWTALLCTRLCGLRELAIQLPGAAVESLGSVLLSAVLEAARAHRGVLYSFEEGAAVTAFGAEDGRATACADACYCAAVVAKAVTQIDAATALCLDEHLPDEPVSPDDSQAARTLSTGGRLPTVSEVAGSLRGVHQAVVWDMMMSGEMGSSDRRSFAIMGPALADVRDLCDRNQALGTNALCTERAWNRIRGDWSFAARPAAAAAVPGSGAAAVAAAAAASGLSASQRPQVSGGGQLWELLFPQDPGGGGHDNVWGLGPDEPVSIVETEEIGRGAFGSVMRALGPRGELLAIKRVKLSAGDAAAEARREYEVMRRLQHPHIVRVFDLLEGDTEEGADYSEFRIVMEYMAGGSVQTILKEYGPLYSSVCARYSQQTLAGLQHLHRMGVIHSDIKPANLLVQSNGALKLADFGLCRRGLETKRKGGAQQVAELLAEVEHGRFGTLPYMSPLLLKSVVYSAQSDLWAFGCTLLEMTMSLVPWSDRGWGGDPPSWVTNIIAADEAGDRPTGAEGATVAAPEEAEVPPLLREFATRCLNAERDGETTTDLQDHPFVQITGSPRLGSVNRHPVTAPDAGPSPPAAAKAPPGPGGASPHDSAPRSRQSSRSPRSPAGAAPSPPHAARRQATLPVGAHGEGAPAAAAAAREARGREASREHSGEMRVPHVLSAGGSLSPLRPGGAASTVGTAAPLAAGAASTVGTTAPLAPDVAALQERDGTPPAAAADTPPRGSGAVPRTETTLRLASASRQVTGTAVSSTWPSLGKHADPAQHASGGCAVQESSGALPTAASAPPPGRPHGVRSGETAPEALRLPPPPHSGGGRRPSSPRVSPRTSPRASSAPPGAHGWELGS